MSGEALRVQQRSEEEWVNWVQHWARQGHDSWITPGTTSTAGDRFVGGFEDGTVRVWAALSHQALLTLRGHQGGVNAAAFSPEGDRIVSGSSDRTVRVWNMGSEQEMLVLRAHEAPVLAAAFSPDGNRVVSGSADNTIRLTWIPRNEERLIETARARLPRELTAEEKRRFYLTSN